VIRWVALWCWVGFALSALSLRGEELVRGRRSLVFRGAAAQLTVDLAGGSLVDFRLSGQELNPLSWAAPTAGETDVRGFGHFLCLDRWGPPSDSEGKSGMPYHGEAAHVSWKAEGGIRDELGVKVGTMSARLPLAGLSVKRTVRFSSTEAYCLVREEVRNENPLGRIFNMVQHPTIGPPFLNDTTVVDSNGRRGFAQGGPLPNPEEPSFYWPQALNQNGEVVNLRRLAGDPNPNVVSFAIDDEWGWVTAATPRQGLLVGYLWRARDYPWFSVWRDVNQGRPAARGLEFGTTGLHQPFSVLTRKGTIFGRPLFEHLDAGEFRVKSYAMFLCRVPGDFAGVAGIEVRGARLVLHERGREANRDLALEAVELP